MFRYALIILLSLSFAARTFAWDLPAAAPANVGMSAERLARIDATVSDSIARGETPGAVVLAARQGRVVWRKAYGNRSVEPSKEQMTPDTIFDMASLTKVMATATSVMILVERGQVRLTDTLGRFFPEMRGTDKERVTIEQLLTHTAGFAPDFDLREQWTGYDEAIRRLIREPLRNPPGARFVYSDLNFITLGEIVHRASGKTLDKFARENIYQPLGMRDTGFRVAQNSPDKISRVAPTETVAGTNKYLNNSARADEKESSRMLRGEVHDPTAQRMNGVAGHAGLFSTADDVAIYCQMILNGGELNGVRVLSPASIAEMTRPRFVNEESSSVAARGLGWDMWTRFSSNRGDLFPPGSFGHTGFTGTSVWIDPASQTFLVFLSNRVHPNGRGDVARVRAQVANIVASSVTDANALSAERALAASFDAAIAANRSSAMTSDVSSSRASTNGTNGDGATARNARIESADVLNGIDVLERDDFKQLSGFARVGLVTNQTGRDRANRQTIDVLNESKTVKLVALFSPEHGIRGVADEKVSDSKDEKTGLPIYSLYGERRRPTPEQLQNLDAIVYDIQDVGARFYTYISTLGNVMEEAAKRGIPVFVLDRPNPINGVDVEGAIADADKLSFVAFERLPVRHGMTIGELARFFKETRKLNCDLRVVKMENWRRQMWFDQTNLVWINPSPNMRSLTEATLYPGIGLLETTNLSVGRGTDTPFELVGAPYIDGRKLAAMLNARQIPGVRFVPVVFTPRASLFKNESCGGINIVVTERAHFHPVRAGIEIALALRALYPNEWKIDDYIRLLANADTLARIKRGDALASIEAAWQTELENFKRARERSLLY